MGLNNWLRIDDKYTAACHELVYIVCSLKKQTRDQKPG
jgi:hypothetical protein